ncbi:prolyl oligopeptidase family serine peptidase [Pseudidiomarina terrestris]|uniref:S9 family peptidase n=1 Tax=Pseudidiomarina terrestris TaxID=2820060 RepID=A0AAW7R0A1_9GAMM|nr:MULTISPECIES: prolyl oligopeptidase family serine peptidase [unclassified Pseudidiomarina]MDN7125548.1 S9 family peptidase [Pseudidiomarina sp. 1APP75-32.1]MDN7126205.1 S9 family peptidase [Pseudidiomarina sp. 1APR75-33.1]MDN7130589.1 S9 family peptidase [Pseudidiomarina sp. 1APR75-15]MDN7134230.1 S9 family peptidase [Pseudidiomarina sp. 1ASP75-5]MDN7137082.1 S9 family peptidase [Pseudidiomarina sp. 1ASP75-14]
MFLRIGLTALCAALSMSASARDISLTETVTTQSINSVAISDDGQVAAFTRVSPRTPYVDDDGGSFVELFVVRGENEPVPFISDKQGVSDVSIHGDFIYFTSKRDGDDHTSIYKISLNGGEAQKVFEHENGIYTYALSADGRYLAFTARAAADKTEKKLAKKGFKAEVYEEENEFTHAWFVDLSAESQIAAQLTDDRQVFSVAFRPDQEQLLLRTAPTPLVDDSYMSSKYELVSFAGVQESSFATVGKLGKAEFSPDGRYLAVIGAADYNDPATGRLYVFDLQNDNSVRDVLPDYPGHVQDIDWRNNDELIYLGHVGTESEVHAITMQWLETRPLLEPGNAIVVDIEAAPGQTGVYARAHRAEHPTELFRLEMQSMIRLTNSNPWLSEITMPTQETVTYEARDGLDLQGILVYPTDYQEGTRYPLITVVHGGPEAHYSNGWLDRYSSPVKHAAQQGYALFFPNYRGSTGRGVEFSKLGQNDYAGKEFDDIVDGKNFLVERGIADGDRAGITGGSYGGFASAWGATAQTEHWAASVMFVGISDNISKFGTTDIAKEMHAVHARSYPWEKWQWYLERSPIYHAEKARTPILIMHGKEDTRVHPSQSMELYRYLKTHGNVPVRLVLYPGEGHGNRRVAAQLDYSMRLMRWMDSFLKQGATEAPAHELPHAEHID